MERTNLVNAGQVSDMERTETNGAATESELKPDAAENNQFGCCNRYRECSEAGCCVVLPGAGAEECAYRKNLEAGRIFYGKNANGFDAKRYAEIEYRVKMLPEKVKKAFDGMVIAFHEYNRGAMSQVVRNEYIEELSGIGVFEFGTAGYFLTHKCSYQNFLKPVLASVQKCEEAFREYKKITIEAEKKKRSGPSRADFCRRWLDKEGREIREKLAEPYRCAEEKMDEKIYLEEYYITHLREGFDTRIYPRSPFAEDGLLSYADFNEEEKCRRSLSHGECSEMVEVSAENLRRRAEEAVARIGRSHQETVFPGRVFVITGKLERMERREALREIEKRGGYTADSPVERMNCLILGYAEWSALHNGVATRKVQKAVELQQRGRDVEIISEEEFYEMLALPAWNDLVKEETETTFFAG